VSGEATLELQVRDVDADAEEVAALAERLRRELLQLDVRNVEQARAGSAPPGAKGVDGIALGTLLVILSRRAATLASVLDAVQRWLGARPTRSVKLELDGDAIELSAASSGEQARLVELWIARHAERP
jgi:hypothetical protein